MEKSGWKYVLCVLLLVLLAAAVIIYVKDLNPGTAMKGATLI